LKFTSLHLRAPFSKTLWFTLLFLMLLFGITEWVMRLEVFQTPLTPPKMGSRHYQLGHKLSLLDDEVRKNGRIDCIMVGSSMVDTGFDPATFQSGYLEMVGREIDCFNFGIDASSAASTAALVKILVEDYQPRILIFGTDARDYAVPSQDNDPAAVLDTPWVRYRQGIFSLEGWLTEHSYLYRYRQHFSRLMRFNFEGTLWSQTKINFEILPNGFTPFDKIGTYVNDPPSPDDDSFEVTYYKRIYSSYQMLDENLDALESILKYYDIGTQVVVVEMPVSNGLYYFFGNGKEDYDRFTARVNELSSLYQVPFWLTEPLDSIPDNGWMDYSHLNTTGAEIFSRWLGQQVGKLEGSGSIESSQP